MTSDENIIEVLNVSKNYKDIKAVCDISLSVTRGKIFGLIGPDGAGKSTLIHIITGVLRTSAGSVKILGKDVIKDPEGIKTSIGFLPQGLGLSLAQELSVEENMNFFADINHLTRSEREERKNILLQSTDLYSFRDRPAKNLSGGMKQKLALCCTLIHEPPVIFLDEPTTGVDPISRRDIWTLVNSMVKEKNITVFLTTSYMDEAARCHDIILLHKGNIVEQGTPDVFPTKLSGNFAEIDVDSLENQQRALKVLRGMPEIKMIYPMGDKINAIFTDCDASQIKNYALEHHVSISSIAAGSPGIEDVFLSKISESDSEIDESVFEEFFQKGAEEKTAAKDSLMIETKELEKKFGDFVAVNKINFDVRRGEIFGFLGPNGAGKTTTIKMLCGLYPPTSGSGTIGDLDFFHQQFEIKKSIGYMSQKFSLYRDLTVAENIILYGGIYGVEKKELVRRKDLLLKIAGLEGEGGKMTSDLPMGIKQRLALGCAIIHKPECIFLDEPTSGVDPIARRQFWDIIYLLSRRMGVTILVTTHYMDEAEHCDRLSLMTRGNIVALGTADSLKKEVVGKIGTLLEISTNDPFAAVDQLKGRYPYSALYGANVHLYTKNAEGEEQNIRKILTDGGIEVRDIRESVIPFEDVFVYFCEKGSG